MVLNEKYIGTQFNTPRDMVESLSFNPLTLYEIILIFIEDEVNERHVL
jgi:hypothetical protein